MTAAATMFASGAMAATFFCAPSARAEEVTLDRLKAVYSGHPGLDADLLQTKESRYLAKPLTSKVHLSVTGKTIRWEVKEPVASTVVFDDQGAHFLDGHGQEEGGTKLPEGPKTEALLGFLKALITVDFTKLEKDFELVPRGHELIATPRPGSAPVPIKKLALVFDDHLKLSELTVTADSETTKIKFTRLELKK